ncbi:hypothetical protein C8R47DRAFT_1078409 [Mycena vitilis]|nr:hypothetical protein C8R47DRAFT_1078409 [Mycena vitilis]
MARTNYTVYTSHSMPPADFHNPYPPLPLYDSQWPEEDDYEPAMTLSYPADFSDVTARECSSRDESCSADFATLEDSKAWRRGECYMVDADEEVSPYGSDSGSFTVSCSYTAAKKCKEPATNTRGTHPQGQWRAVAKAVNRTSPPLSLPLLPTIKQKKKTAHTKAQRRASLEEDTWAQKVTPHSVVCRGCKRTIQLDARNEYYPGLWVKHRDQRCEGVKRWRAQEQRARTVSEEMSAFVEAEAGTSARLTPPVSFHSPLVSAPLQSLTSGQLETYEIETYRALGQIGTGSLISNITREIGCKEVMRTNWEGPRTDRLFRLNIKSVDQRLKTK